jgi:hypothetical protein
MEIIMKVSTAKVEMTFVPNGYEADLYADGKYWGHSVRDFGKDQVPKKMSASFLYDFISFLDKFRQEHDK